jgi:hypothetical protein
VGAARAGDRRHDGRAVRGGRRRDAARQHQLRGAGDHGGAQQPVQEIPIVFAGAGIGKHDSKAPMRSVDILPTILRQMGIAPRPGLDGAAQEIPTD